MNDCAPGLALIERLKATRKWAIGLLFCHMVPLFHKQFRREKKMLILHYISLGFETQTNVFFMFSSVLLTSLTGSI